MRARLLLLFLPLVLGATGACTRRASDSGKAPALRVHLSSDPVSLDPALAEDGISLRVLSNVMEGLVGYDGGGKLENRLAESYEISPDGLRYEFELSDEAKWSDGVPVTAEQFVIGMRRALSPATASKLAPMLFAIRGAKDYNSGKGSELGVFVNDGKLVIELERPVSYFIQALALSVAMPAREDILKASGGKWPELAPSTGPYRIGERRADRAIVLERVSGPGPSRVEFIVVQDETTAMHLFDQGKLDILTRVPALDLDRVRKDGLLRIDPFLATYYLSFNTKKAPFDRAEWRRAVSGAIRREQLVEILGSGEKPARSWVPDTLEGGMPYVDPRPVFAESVARVKGKSKRAIPLGFDSSSRNANILEKVQQDVLRELGMKLVLNNLDWKSHVRAISTDAPPIYRFGWLAPFLDPISHLQAFTTGNPNNHSKWSNAEYDALVAEVEKLPSGPERVQKILKAQEILVDREAAVVPLFHYVQAHAVAARVKGFRANPFGVVRFAELSIN